MRVFPKIGIVFLFLSLLTVGQSHAFSFRCGVEIVSVGDTQSEVIEKCGKPDWVESKYGPVPPETRRQAIPPETRMELQIVEADRWYYNLGPNQFIRILVFNQGVLVNIEAGGYGY